MSSSYRKKLIEVALPLDAINAESAREKSIRHGHPSTLHLWWARRPLAACRAVLFAQLVDDPSEYMPDEKSADEERERLFGLIEELVKWENINNEEVLDRARLEIARSVARDLGESVPVGKQAIREYLATKAPPVLDPFAGGGSIPLEAQRLGLRAYASDLNPVAVLINKALIEIPPKFAGMPPVHPPESKEQQLSLMKKEWIGAEGLAEDVRYYGKWMRDEAEKQIGHLYPKYKITQELLDERPDLKAQGLKPSDELNVIAWLWARTIKCPNPGCGASLPLITTFWLSQKTGNFFWIKPIIDNKNSPPQIRFTIQSGKGQPPAPPKVGRGAQFQCLACNQIASEENLRNQFINKQSWYTLLAIVAETSSGRIYVPPTDFQNNAAKNIQTHWKPEEEMNVNVSDLVSGRGYGFTHWHELFTPRQLLGLVTLSEQLQKVQSRIINDISNHHSDQWINEYSIAVTTYLGMAVSRLTDIYNAFCRWEVTRTQVRNLFTRQAIPMMWDFAEPNLFSKAAGDFETTLGTMLNVIERLPGGAPGEAKQQNAIDSLIQSEIIISCDPPYYDNINYADLSDFFYIWLRKNLRNFYPDIFATLLVPKSQELIAASYRFGGDIEKARHFFESGMTEVLRSFRNSSTPAIPVTIYYAYKQSEEKESGRSSTGWETFLESIVRTGFFITGTWPIRTELANRMLASNTNALASSVVLVCRPRLSDAPITTRRDFISSLRQELPKSLRKLQLGSIAPVDLAQAAIGPGMAIYSRYSRVLDADGSPMPVRTALALINQALDEFLTEQEGEYDADTRWALAWYEQYGFNDGPFGVAETLSKAKNTSVGGLGEAGILLARAGKVRLLSRTELKEDWDPTQDKRPTAWEAVQYLIRALDTHGEQGAALLLSRLGGLGEVARDLAYRLYTICERKGWAQDALGYNMLVVAWPRLKEMARSQRPPAQGRLL